MSDSRGRTVHRIEYEERPASCCDRHRARWAKCSCGWEKNGGLDGSGLSGATLAHRLSVVEAALGIQVRFGSDA